MLLFTKCSPRFSTALQGMPHAAHELAEVLATRTLASLAQILFRLTKQQKEKGTCRSHHLQLRNPCFDSSYLPFTWNCVHSCHTFASQTRRVCTCI